MAILDRIRGELPGETRVDSEASHRPQPILRLVPAPDPGGDFTVIDSHGTSLATPPVASTIAGTMHYVPVRTPSRKSSATYFATIRRGEIQKIMKIVTSLGQQADREDFAVCFFPIVNGIRQLLDRLADAESEGNSREILRRLRDTVLDGGWSRYRDLEARKVAEQIIDYLARADGVTRDDVKRFSDLLRTKGLKAAGIPVFDLDDEGEGIDVEEAEEVSD
jgi:hypothetical protein